MSEEKNKRLRGLVEFQERTIKRLEIDNEKLRKDLDTCNEAYEKCRKVRG